MSDSTVYICRCFNVATAAVCLMSRDTSWRIFWRLPPAAKPGSVASVRCKHIQYPESTTSVDPSKSESARINNIRRHTQRENVCFSSFPERRRINPGEMYTTQAEFKYRICFTVTYRVLSASSTLMIPTFCRIATNAAVSERTTTLSSRLKEVFLTAPPRLLLLLALGASLAGWTTNCWRAPSRAVSVCGTCYVVVTGGLLWCEQITESGHATARHAKDVAVNGRYDSGGVNV